MIIRRILMVILILVLVTPITLYLHKLWSPKQPNLEEISQICGLQFPQNAKLVGSYVTGDFGMQLFARIEMDRSAVERWVTETTKNMEMSEVSNIKRIDSISRETNDWWKPGSPTRFISMIVRPKYKFESQILIDMDDGRRVTLYLYRTR